MRHLVLFYFLLFFAFTSSAQIDFSWAYGCGSVAVDIANSVTEDNTGALIATGFFTDIVDFDPGPENEYVDPGTTGTFITKVDASGNFMWVKCLLGDGVVVGNSIVTDGDNNIYVAGYFQNTVDFNPNGAVYNMTSEGLNDGFIVKLSENGGFIWAKQIGGTDNDAVNEIVLDADGQIYMTGYFRDTADLETGPGITNFISHGEWDSHFSKLDANGNTIWVKAIGGLAEDIMTSIAVAPTGNIYISGYFRAATDFDPNAGEAIITTPLGPVVAKYSNDGDYIWAKSYGSSGYSNGIALDGEENVITVGYNPGGMDLDPGPGIVMAYLPGAYGSTYYISKLNTNGEYIWGESFGGVNKTNIASSVVIDYQSNIYVTGFCTGTYDADPGPGLFNIVASNQDDIFMHKLDPDGNFIHAFKIGGGNWDRGEDILITNNGDIVMTGTFDDAVDFNPGPEIYYPNYNHGFDIFISKFNQNGCSNLTIVVDSLVDIDCENYEGLGIVHGANTAEPYTYSWNTIPETENDTVIFPGGGWYTVTVTDNYGCVKSSTLLVNGPTELSDKNFNVNLSAGTFRPGNPTIINLDAYNSGCFQSSGQIKVVLPQIVEYNTADPLPDIISGDTLIWNFSSITFESAHITPVITATTEIGVPIGTPVLIHTEIGPNDGDTDTTNNIKDYSYEVQNSFDPNDKQVYPQGACDKGYILNNQEMTYTIRFQNTGTLEALDIYILDTISTYLDINSLQVVGASHNYVTELLPDNMVKFRFDDIYLPDSTTNEPESHGYISYAINQNPDLPNNTKIKNTAAIYFDFNDPVITNTVLNTITNDINTYSSTNNIMICEGDSIIVGYHVYKEPGSYIDVLSTDAGCDSTVLTILGVNNGVNNVINATICADEGYTFNGITYFTSGWYEATFLAANGCDSSVQLNLEVKPDVVHNISAAICADEIFEFNGEFLNTPGIYQAVYPAANGCDSTVFLDLTHLPITGTAIEAAICNDESYWFNGTEYTAAGYYEAMLTDIHGCDSVVGLTLAVNENYLNDTYVSLCEGDSVLFDGNYYNSAGDYSANYIGVQGCDSIEFIHIDMLTSYAHHIDTTICSNQYITFNGDQYSTAGIYIANLTTIAGCDSIVTLNLFISEMNTEVAITDTTLFVIQDGATYQWIDCENGYLPIEGETAQFFQPSLMGNYAVIINNNNCIDTSACFQVGPLSIANPMSQIIQLYPNPADATIHLKMQNILTESNIAIYNSLGQLVYALNNPTQSVITIPIANWKPGCYVVQFTASNYSTSATFIKE